MAIGLIVRLVKQGCNGQHNLFLKRNLFPDSILIASALCLQTGIRTPFFKSNCIENELLVMMVMISRLDMMKPTENN